MQNQQTDAPRWGWVALYCAGGVSFAGRAIAAATAGQAKIPFAGTLTFAEQPWSFVAAVAALALISVALFFCAYENYRPQASNSAA